MEKNTNKKFKDLIELFVQLDCDVQADVIFNAFVKYADIDTVWKEIAKELNFEV